jgi:hypothetical protein
MQYVLVSLSNLPINIRINKHGTREANYIITNLQSTSKPFQLVSEHVLVTAERRRVITVYLLFFAIEFRLFSALNSTVSS